MMLTDRELQTLRNQGNEAEDAADEICSLRAEVERLKVHAVVLANTEREVERERCARIAETVHPHWTHIAAAIRGA